MDQNSANVTVSVAVILRGEEKVQDFFFIHRPIIILFLRPDYHISMYFLSSVCGES